LITCVQVGGWLLSVSTPWKIGGLSIISSRKAKDVYALRVNRSAPAIIRPV